MTSRPNIDALRLQIRNARCTSLDRRPFVPEASLYTIFTGIAIEEAVAEINCQPEDKLGLADDIRAKGITTFAILIWMGREDAIVDFRRREYLDSYRLDETTAVRVAPKFGLEFVREYSWQFRPHHFHLGDSLDELDERKILPFLGEEIHIEEGGFGLVSKLEVHPLLQDFYPGADRPVRIVRKTLRRASPEARRKAQFQNERRSLLLLNSRKHHNIIPFYGAYKYGKDFCLLFPVLDMDLKDFFRLDRRYGEFQWDFTFISALRGLSSALQCVHDVRLRQHSEGVDFTGVGYHHDLRPANILVTKETFVLADFGLGRVKPAEQDSRTPWKAGAGDYLAPECMNEDLITRDVGRAIDVWAFGCLIAEVATFMRKGAGGLDDFCNARLSPGVFVGLETSYFYDNSGGMKDSVGQWLSGLIRVGCSTPVEGLLHNLVSDVLSPLHKRPVVSQVCHRLSWMNLQARYDAVLSCFDTIVQDMPSRSTASGSLMKIWFERERLKAFGKVLCLNGATWNTDASGVAYVENETLTTILINLFRRLQSFIGGNNSPTPSKTNDTSDGDILREPPGLAGAELEQPGSQTELELSTDAQRCTHELWDLLPKIQLKKVENIWVNSMIKEEDGIENLENLGHALRKEASAVYQESAGMAMMRKIRLELSSRTEYHTETVKMQIPASEIEIATSHYGHQLGWYKENTPVVIEWACFSPNWYKIPPVERALVMSLKAEGFGVYPKPNALCTLHCLGFCEKNDLDELGYGFIYLVPPLDSSDDGLPVPLVTLNTLLERSTPVSGHNRLDVHLNQPLLADKYRLASSLVEFIKELHTIGWLHENLRSHNVVFFQDVPSSECISANHSKVITHPHVLGLHKSRPGGEKWNTEGPAFTGRHYNSHPDYEITRHFRHSYDYYSLGLILLEIGLWTPLKAWLGISYTIQPHDFRDLLIKRYVPRLGPRMGSVYRDIVHKLLLNVLDPFSAQRRPNPENEREVYNRFIDEVSEPLLALSDIPL